MLVTKYIQRFEVLKIRSKLVQDNSQTTSWFNAGLRDDIKRKLIRQSLQLQLHLQPKLNRALDVEEYFEIIISKKWSVFGYGNHSQGKLWIKKWAEE